MKRPENLKYESLRGIGLVSPEKSGFLSMSLKSSWENEQDTSKWSQSSVLCSANVSLHVEHKKTPHFYQVN